MVKKANKAGKKKAPVKEATPKAKKVESAKKITAAGYMADLLALRGKDEPPDFTPMAQQAYTVVTERIPTGSLALDKLTNGGWPVGRMTEICAWEGVGKSTILDQSVAQCQRMGGIAIGIDSERARELKYTQLLGVDTEKFIIAEAETLEDSFSQIDKVIAVQEKKRKLLKGKVPPILLVWDSLGGTPAKAELNGKPEDDHVSVAARRINMNFKRIVGKLIVNRIALVFANHFYKNIGGFGGLSAYGGKGVRYYPSIRLWLTRGDHVKIGTEVTGHIIKAKLKKTKVGKPREPEEIGLIHNSGISNAWTLFHWGKSHGIGGEYPDHKWIVQRGSYTYLVPPGGETMPIKRQHEGLGVLLTEHPDIYQQFAAAYMAS